MEKNLVVSKEETDIVLSPDDVKQFLTPNATEKELFMFLNICKSYNLNPFKREIHFIKYGNSPGSVIVGYETYLKRAERTNQLDGWNVKIINKGTPDEKAEITIYRKDRTHPIVWEVDRKEFDRQQSSWKNMPNFMLKKVAIAQAFRLAFPVEMGGMPYIIEELPHTYSQPEIEPEQKPKTWNPYDEPVRERYGQNKAIILKEAAEKLQLDVKGKLPRDVHQMILDTKSKKEQENFHGHRLSPEGPPDGVSLSGKQKNNMQNGPDPNADYDDLMTAIRFEKEKNPELMLSVAEEIGVLDNPETYDEAYALLAGIIKHKQK